MDGRRLETKAAIMKSSFLLVCRSVLSSVGLFVCLLHFPAVIEVDGSTTRRLLGAGSR